ncbi:hypothetical protein GGR56DRAFT_629620, partial [Xylariaceae sp. FL0804]
SQPRRQSAELGTRASTHPARSFITGVLQLQLQLLLLLLLLLDSGGGGVVGGLRNPVPECLPAGGRFCQTTHACNQAAGWLGWLSDCKVTD